MCKDTNNLTLSKWREVYFDSSQSALFLDTQDGVWMIGGVTRCMIENHITTYGAEDSDWIYGVDYDFDKYAGRSFKQRSKICIVDIDDWLDHYIDTHHSELLEIPE